ncbi:MAG: hypothetical protein ABIR47_00830 [Candidatus Kapaibacterium sp.]
MQRDIVRFEHLALFMLLIMATTFNGCYLLDLFHSFHPDYGPVADWHGGYEDVQIDKNTHRVRYYGMGLAQERAERYLIYRCAELTVAQGYDYFIIIDQADDPQTESSVTNSTTSQSASGTGFSATGASVTSRSNVQTYTYYNPVKTIKVFKGKKPEDNFKAYDGREVTATLAPKIEFRDSTDAAR